MNLLTITSKSTIRIIFLFAFILNFQSIYCQFTTSEGFNYYDVNEAAYTVDASCFNIGDEAESEIEYWFTAIQLANALKSMYNSVGIPPDLEVGAYKISKHHYLNTTLGGESFKWLLIRPNDEVVRPTVLVTHGGQSSDADPLRVLSLGVFDLVQRGFAVVYYQSGSSQAGSAVEALEDAGFTADCQYNWSPGFEFDCFQQAVYLKMQFAVAAIQYAVANKDALKLDDQLLFMQGFSGGGVGTLYAALADAGDFQSTLFDGLGPFDNLSVQPGLPFQIKAVSSYAGGLVSPLSENDQIGNIIDVSDVNTRFLLFHGQDDDQVKPTTGPLVWTVPDVELPGSQISCALDIGQQLKQFDIPAKVVINCSACHNIFTFPCDYNDDCLTNNPQFLPNIGECIDWAGSNNFTGFNYDNLCAPENDRDYWDKVFYILAQIHDYSKISAHFYHQDFDDNGLPAAAADPFIEALLSDNKKAAINPSDFPFNESLSDFPNGHFILSDKCLQQNCSALFFNKLGVGDQINDLYFGDYLKTSDAGLTIFNEDFTLELQVKPIDHSGEGILFSHLNNGLQGFEILITNSGFLQFKKNINGNGAITGSTSLLDGLCHNIVLQRNGNKFSLFLDGELQEIEKTYNISFPNAGEIRLGNSRNEVALLTGNDGFNGIMRYVRFWDKILSPYEFGQTEIAPTEEGLISEWVFDQLYGQEIYSTNNQFVLRLGNLETNASYDPFWMSNDEICACSSDPPFVSASTNIQKSETTMVVFPNPGGERFSVRLENSSSVEGKISLLDLQGAVLFQSTIQDNFIELTAPYKGIFILQYRQGNQLLTKKIVIQ